MCFTLRDGYARGASREHSVNSVMMKHLSPKAQIWTVCIFSFGWLGFPFVLSLSTKIFGESLAPLLSTLSFVSLVTFPLFAAFFSIRMLSCKKHVAVEEEAYTVGIKIGFLPLGLIAIFGFIFVVIPILGSLIP